MNKKVVFLFPGQGAQAIGMMRDFYETFPSSRRVFEEAEDILKTSLTDLIFEGSKEVLTQTINAQRAIFVASYAVLEAFRAECPECIPYATAGLSLGEYTALAATRRASFSDLVPIVHKRASLMQEACEKVPSSMSVVLGQEPSWIEEVLKRAMLPVWIANLNCPGQVVIAGDTASLALATEALKAAGARRIMPLDVSGAFHTPLMLSAKEALAPHLEQLELKDSSIPLIMNAQGDKVEDSALIRRLLIEQVTSPVYWEKGIKAVAQEADLFIEMGPGTTLAGMNKRIGIQAPTHSIQTIEDMKTVLTYIEAHYAT